MGTSPLTVLGEGLSRGLESKRRLDTTLLRKEDVRTTAYLERRQKLIKDERTENVKYP